MMKIQPGILPNQIAPVGTEVKRPPITDRPSSEKFAHFLTETEPGKATASPRLLAPLVTIDPMLVAAAGDALDPRKRGQKRGHQVLDRLDRIRHALLSGQLSQAEIEDLIKALASEREEFNDLRLAELLDEIELRAQVELAKFQSNNNL